MKDPRGCGQVVSSGSFTAFRMTHELAIVKAKARAKAKAIANATAKATAKKQKQIPTG